MYLYMYIILGWQKLVFKGFKRHPIIETSRFCDLSCPSYKLSKLYQKCICHQHLIESLKCRFRAWHTLLPSSQVHVMHRLPMTAAVRRIQDWRLKIGFVCIYVVITVAQGYLYTGLPRAPILNPIIDITPRPSLPPPQTDPSLLATPSSSYSSPIQLRWQIH